jgi:Kef-type K+ transport system membrane component KefB
MWEQLVQYIDFESVNQPFFEFAVILIIASVVGAIGKLLKQPLIVSFIAVGILVGPSVFNIVSSDDSVHLLAEMGIAILLFVVGLKLDLNLIKTTGPVALITGLGQVIFTSIIGFFIAWVLGYPIVASLYIAVALTFSSTIIIVKMLSDKKELDTLHGQIAMGFLIVQDIVVVLAMIVLSAFGEGNTDTTITTELVGVLVKGFLFVGLILLLMKYVIPSVINRLAASQELLVLFSIAWAVLLASAGDMLGFSKEVGAFLAGISLASTQFKEVISGRLATIRDFLLLFFFIYLGSSINLELMGAQVLQAFIFSVFVLVGNPIIVMVIMGIMKYRSVTSFKAGLAVAQISEFSLILAALGMDLGHIDEETLGLITLVGLITIGLSTYLILYSDQIFKKISPMLTVFERKHPDAEEKHKQEEKEVIDIVVIGYGRFGSSIARLFEEKNYKVLIVDFDPQVVLKKQKEGKLAQYADAEDPDLPNLLELHENSLVVSTLASFETSLKIIKYFKDHGYKGKTALTVHYDTHSVKLKNLGVDYVLNPFDDAADKVVAYLTDKV